MLACNDPLERTGNEQVSLDVHPRIGCQLVACIPERLLRLLLEARPIHPGGKHDERVHVHRDEQ